MKLFGIRIGDAKSIAIGAGLVLLAPVAVSTLSVVLKPLTKSFIKTGLIWYEKLKITFAETKEVLEDLAAEAKAEIAGPTAAGKAAKGAKKTAGKKYHRGKRKNG